MKKTVWILAVVLLGVSQMGAQSLPIDTINDYKLTWEDEFDYPDSDLDTEWNSQNGASGGYVICSRWRENAVVKDGILELQAKKESRGGQDWTAASIWTKKKFHYGYYECRYKYAGATGTNNSFWMWTGYNIPEGQKAVELDVNEGHFPNEINTNIHNWSDKDEDGKHPTWSKAYQIGISDPEPAYTHVLEPNHITTNKIRFSSTHGAHFHIGEFRIYAPNANGYPQNPTMDNADSQVAGLVNYTRAADTKITSSGYYPVSGRDTEAKNVADGKNIGGGISWIAPATGEKWLEIELSEAKEIGCIQFTNGWYGSGEWKAMISNYKIEYLKDGEWITLAEYDQTGGNDFSEEFHTYGMLWDENQVSYYFDGELLRTFSHDFIHAETHVYLSLALLSNNIAGAVTDAIDGTSMKVDWVRYYEKTENNDTTSTDETDVSGVWRQISPGMAGSNRALHTDAVDPNKIWATPDMGNDYVSLDGGKHWETTVPYDGIWTQRKTLSDECIISDHKNNNVVLSLNKKDIYLSTDGGVNFNKISQYESGQEPNSVWFTAAAHPTEDGTWYVANGLDNQYVRTGATPNPTSSIETSKSKIYKITNITSFTRTISAVANDGMEDNSAVFDLIIHPDTEAYPNMLFAATSTGLYRKDSESASWVKILNGCVKADYQWNESTLTLYALQQTTYKVEGSTLISEGGTFKSVSPETATLTTGWEDKSSALWIDLTKVDVNNNHYKNMLKSWFGYTSGEEESIDLPTSYLQDYSDILCDPTNADKVYLSVWGGTIGKPLIGSIWATTNGGDTWFSALRLGTGYTKNEVWKTSQPGKTNRNVPLQIAEKKFPDFVTYGTRGVRTMAIAVDGTLYASAVKGYYTVKYNSETDTWESVDDTKKDGLYYGHGNNDTGAFGIIPDKHHPGEMFLLQYEASAYKSTDKVHEDFPGIVGVSPIESMVDIGPTWAPGQPLNTPITMATHPSDPEIFYYMSARTGEIRKCTRTGTTHETMGEPVEVPNTLNVSQMKCAYWSDLRIAQDGKTMYAILECIDTDNRPMGQVYIYNPESRKGVYKSTDEGKTWTVLNDGLPNTSSGRNASGTIFGTNSACLKALVMDPQNEEILFAAAKRYRAPKGTSGWVNGGLFRSVNGSQSWNKMTIPSGIKSVWDVWLHESNGMASKIYIAAGGEGSTSDWGEGGVWVADYKSEGTYSTSDWTKIFNHPFVSHVRTSPDNSNNMLLATRESSSNGKVDAGTFYTINGGSGSNNGGWTKFNTGRGSMRIGDIAFDNGNPNRVWCAVESSGIYTALLQTTKIGELDSLVLLPSRIGMEVNQSYQLDARIYPLGISPYSLTWQSLNEDIASVTESGMVTLKKESSTQIVVSAMGISDTCTIFHGVNSGFSKTSQQEVIHYPNPVQRTLNFANVTSDSLLSIFNLQGKKVMETKLNKNKSIDISELPTGIYCYMLKNDRQCIHDKFIKN